MLKLQNGVIASIENLVGKKIDILHQHTLLFNGFSFKGEYGWIKKINESVSGARAFLPMEWSVPETISAADVATRTIGSSQTGADDAWSAGYNGAGTAVAILDTGLVIGHKAFAVSPTGTPKYTQSSISTIVSQGKLNANTTAANLYYSAKIPFRYNYNTNTNDVLNTGAGSPSTITSALPSWIVSCRASRAKILPLSKRKWATTTTSWCKPRYSTSGLSRNPRT